MESRKILSKPVWGLQYASFCSQLCQEVFEAYGQYWRAQQVSGAVQAEPQMLGWRLLSCKGFPCAVWVTLERGHGYKWYLRKYGLNSNASRVPFSETPPFQILSFLSSCWQWGRADPAWLWNVGFKVSECNNRDILSFPKHFKEASVRPKEEYRHTPELCLSLSGRGWLFWEPLHKQGDPTGTCWVFSPCLQRILLLFCPSVSNPQSSYLGVLVFYPPPEGDICVKVSCATHPMKFLWYNEVAHWMEQ